MTEQLVYNRFAGTPHFSAGDENDERLQSSAADSAKRLKTLNKKTAAHHSAEVYKAQIMVPSVARYEDDLEHAYDVDRFADVILNMTQRGDMVYANNAARIYRFPRFHGTSRELSYKDSTSLSAGDIPKRQLRKLIVGTLQKEVYFTIEINEPAGRMLEAPNTKEYLDYVLRVA